MTFWEKFADKSIPWEIITILKATGYDNSLSLHDIDENEICLIERSVGKGVEAALKTSKYYFEWTSTEPFTFLPGHKKTIIQLGKEAIKFRDTVQKEDDFQLCDAPFILKEIIMCLKQNKNVAPTKRRYSEALQSFATYIFMLCGKAGYEVLSNNLLLPQACTICKS